MKKIYCLLLGIIMGGVFVNCSSDDEDFNQNNEAKKYLAEISILEYEWKFGERSNYGELYELYKYNDKGKITSFESHHYLAALKGRNSESTQYKYDEKDRLIEKNEYNLSLLKYKYKYEYNSFDSVSVMYKYYKDGSLDETHKYEYDNNRRLPKEIRIVNSVRNDYGYVDTYEYNGNTVIVITTLLDDGSFFWKSVDEYDSHNNLIRSSSTSEKGNTTTYIYKYEYDSKGRIAKKTSPYRIANMYEEYREYSYNDDGTIEKIHVSNNDNNDQSDLVYTYTYK